MNALQITGLLRPSSDKPIKIPFKNLGASRSTSESPWLFIYFSKRLNINLTATGGILTILK